MKVLIAHDGTEFGRSAIRFAARLLGLDRSATVKIVTVTEPAAGTELEAVVLTVDEMIDPARPEYQEARQTCEAGVELFKESTDEGGPEISYEVLAGPAAQTIVEHSEKWGADLIVMGSHGRGLWSRTLVGSVSDRVLHHASCSAMIVRANEP